MNPRLTDWSLAAGIAVAFASGMLSLVSGRPEDWWVFIIHGISGLWLLPLTLYKLWRVRKRLLPRAWDRRTLIGVATSAAVLLTLASGIAWTSGGNFVVLGYNLLNWHIIFGLLLTAAVSAHMVARARPLAARHLRDRRQLLRLSGIFAGAIVFWPAQQALARRLGTPGGQRRFTGSREVGSYGGNHAFPLVSWFADRPLPLDLAAWRLRVGGLVAKPLTLALADLTQHHATDFADAVLDCTGGFFTAQIWRGMSVGRLLDAAEPLPAAQFVRFTSVTGYRWSLPLGEARQALLATHIGDAPLRHGHGAPARLVAPQQRGFVWVKWVVAVEVLREPDFGQLATIYTSGFTPIGAGER